MKRKTDGKFISYESRQKKEWIVIVLNNFSKELIEFLSVDAAIENLCFIKRRKDWDYLQNLKQLKFLRQFMRWKMKKVWFTKQMKKRYWRLDIRKVVWFSESKSSIWIDRV